MAVLVIADSHLEGQGEDGLALGDVATRLETASAAAAVGEADGQTAPRGAALYAPLDELAHHRALANLIVRLHVRAVGGSVGCGSVGGFRRRGRLGGAGGVVLGLIDERARGDATTGPSAVTRPDGRRGERDGGAEGGHGLAARDAQSGLSEVMSTTTWTKSSTSSAREKVLSV